jgi:ABC-2 type transport system ATP-binding protein
LIKILLGLLPATAGSATVLGLDVATAGGRIREAVGYMPEHDCLPPDVTATSLVVHLARMSGLPTAAARERTADTLRHVGLYEERYRAIGTYSTGMRQRVKLAQALVHDPRLVLLDEPTNGLDPAGRDDMLALIRRIGTTFGISVLVTSHLMGELERVCDHVVVIDGGRLLRSAATSEVTGATGRLTLEVSERQDDVAAALAARGLQVRRVGTRLELVLDGEATYDVVRDEVADLGVGLVRLQRGRHHMLDLFRDDEGAAGTEGGAA